MDGWGCLGMLGVARNFTRRGGHPMNKMRVAKRRKKAGN